MTLLSMTRGDTAVFTVTLTDVHGDALDLADWTLTFTAKRRLQDPDDAAIMQKTNGSGIEVTNEAGGVVTITVDPADTRDLEDLSTLRWDLQIENGDEVRTPLSGSLAIRPDVTRSTAAS